MNVAGIIKTIMQTIMFFNLLSKSARIPMQPNRFLSDNLGKTFEKAICLLYNTKYYGDEKQYHLPLAEKLMERSIRLKEFYPSIQHVNDYSSKYDFILGDSEEKYLSAKTTKYRGKVCPQVIGQCTRKNFCHHFNLAYLDIANVKEFIQNNIQHVVTTYFENTFLCPILYYNENENTLSIIKKRQDILWKKYTLEFRHIQKNKEWGGSTTLYLIDEVSENNIPLGEFQIHTNRDVIKFRWYFENLLQYFPEKFEIIYL
jgi:hypothetical protein